MNSDSSKKKKKKLKFRGKKKKYYETLMAARDLLTKQIKYLENEALKSKSNSSGEKSGFSNHQADISTDYSIHNLELQLLSEDGNVLEEIEEALERLEDGTYGKCFDCRCEISDARLSAKPHSKFCIKCKTLREENGGENPLYEE